jgi:hypothetical protein
MVGWSMNNKLQSIWKEAAVGYWRYNPGIFLEELRDTAKKSVKIAGISPEILRDYVPNRCLERYRWVIPPTLHPQYQELAAAPRDLISGQFRHLNYVHSVPAALCAQQCHIRWMIRIRKLISLWLCYVFIVPRNIYPVLSERVSGEQNQQTYGSCCQRKQAMI